MIGLDGLEGIDGGGLGLTNHLDGGFGAHTGPLGGLQGGVFGGVGPDGGTGQDEFDLGGGHEGLAVAAGEGVDGVAVDLGEVVADGVDDHLVVLFQLGGRLEGAYIEGKLLGAVEEQLDAAQAGLVGAELEAPFDDGLLRLGGVESVRDLGGDLVRGDAVAAGPCLDDVDVVGGGRVDGGDAREGGAEVDAHDQPVTGGHGQQVPDGLPHRPIHRVAPAVLVPLAARLRPRRPDREVDAHLAALLVFETPYSFARPA